MANLLVPCVCEKNLFPISVRRPHWVLRRSGAHGSWIYKTLLPSVSVKVEFSQLGKENWSISRQRLVIFFRKLRRSHSATVKWSHITPPTSDTLASIPNAGGI